MAEQLIKEEIIDPDLESTIKKNILLYFSGALVSNFGTFMYNFAIGLYVLSLTGSGQTFAFSILFGMVPRIILSPFAGVFADRFDRKKMTVMMDLFSGILLIGVFVTTQYTPLSLGIIYFSSAALTIFNTFFGISIGASIPNLVDEKRLVKVNSMRAMIDSTASIAGPFLGGIIYALIGIKYFILLNGISFIFSGISEMFINFNIHNREINPEAKSQSFGQTMKEGFGYLKDHKLIIGLMKYIILINFIASSIVIALPYTSVKVLGATPTEYGFIQMGFPAGLFVMSLLFTFFNKSHTNIFKKTTLSMFQFGLLMLLMGLPSNPILNMFPEQVHMILIFAISTLLGMVIISINIPLQTMMQLTIDDAFRGRVGGVISMMSQSIMPIGILVFGFLVDRINSYLLPIISGILILAIGLLMTRDKELQQL
jgi:MFS family permease